MNEVNKFWSCNEEFYILKYSKYKIHFSLAESTGCVRNATYMLFAALKSGIPGGCPKVMEKIEEFS